MMVQLKIKHENLLRANWIYDVVYKFCYDRYFLKQTIHIEISTKYTFKVDLQVDN